MSKLHTLRNILSFIPKKVLVVFGVIAMSAAVAIPVLTNAYGPERATFTMEKPADYVTFNSITNNPNIGDERNFVAARVDDGTAAGINNVWNGNEITAENGKSYFVRLYVHNNAAANLNLVATNVRAMAGVPTNTANNLTITGYVSADNSNPKKIWDDVTFKSDKDFYLSVDADYGVHYANNGVGFGTDAKLDYNNFFNTNGALLGYDKLDGRIPGCLHYAGYVSFKVKPVFENADFSVSKQVKPHGSNDPNTWKSASEQGVTWDENYVAEPGELVTFRIDYTNLTGDRQDNVTLRDILPAGLMVESVRFWNTLTGEWQTPVNNITTTGINIGSIIGENTKTRAELAVRMPSLENLTCGTNTFNNIGRISIDGGSSKEDGASVVVTKECEEEKCDIPGKEDLDKDDPACKEDVEPDYICELLTADRISIKRGEKVNFTVTPRMRGNVSVKEYKIDFGDASNFTQTKNTFEHTFANKGEYKVQAFVTFNVDGQTVAGITSAACTKTIKVTDTPPVDEKCPIKGKEHLEKDDPNCYDTPKELPKTGGELGAAIGISSVATAAAYYVASRRKIS